MKKAIMPYLAWTGIRKNRKIYIPYILTCIGMVMMFFIIHSLSCSEVVKSVEGGNNMALFLDVGKYVIAVFAVFFLLYTNSFLTRRRYREFGLYNILGLDKRSLGKIACWESLYVAVIGLGAGIGLGILFQKLAELGLLNVVQQNIGYAFTVSSDAVVFTLVLFGIIFALLLVKSVVSIKKYSAIELLENEKAGEKPPKANWVITVAGVVILCVAYYITVSIESPLTAIEIFFIAVGMIISATYMLFVSGSVTMCRALQKNKGYYYKKEHFVSVSNMAYRMKRNGAGLATTCILVTMVLVMISSTASLYFGINDTVSARYPEDAKICMNVGTTDNLSDIKVNELRERFRIVFEDLDFQPENCSEYRYSYITGMLSGAEVNTDASLYYDEIINFENLRTMIFISQDDYSALQGIDIGKKLNENEVLICPYGCQYKNETLSVNGKEFRVTGTFENSEMAGLKDGDMASMPTLILVIDSYDSIKHLDGLYDSVDGLYGTFDDKLLRNCWGMNFDLPGNISEDEQIELFRNIKEGISEDEYVAENGYSFDKCSCRQIDLFDFYSTLGGLFFIGIILSGVFIFAACIILYYKQISEGYEDYAGFTIMQKVGMTKADIRKCINSQILTVFFVPLICSGMHLAFVFPMLWKLMQLFYLDNLGFVIMVTIIVFGIFALFYVLVYKLTSKSYYQIVSDYRKS